MNQIDMGECVVEEKRKTCSCCGQEKSFDDFHNDRSKKDGKRSWCRYCVSIRKSKNPENERKRRRQWRNDNPEKERERNLRWRQNNPNKNREIGRRWAQNNPEKVREKSKRWKKNNPDKVRAINARQVQVLSDSYVASLIGLPGKDIPKEVIELKREQIKMHRLLKEVKRGAS